MADGIKVIQPLKDPRLSKIIQDSWNHYKKTMIDENGRPLCEKDVDDIDGDNNREERLTFSEGVGYVLLRAVEMNDKETFVKTWNWAKKNMQRKNIDKVYYWNQEKWIDPPKKDNLMAWRYIPSLKGRSGGVIHYDWVENEPWRGCFEGASDADLDIATALSMAGNEWKVNEYVNDAKEILNDIWDKYVGKVGDHYYLFAGDQFRGTGEINPSYMRPACFKEAYFKSLFPKIDPKHPWGELYKSSYKAIIESGKVKLNGEYGKVNLPSNWIKVNEDETFSDSLYFQLQGGHLFGWDAFRTLFFVAQDYAWNGTPESRKYLTDNTGTSQDAGPYYFLKKELGLKGKILGGYDRNGSNVDLDITQAKGLNQEQFTMYGAYLPFFYYAGDDEASKKIMEKLNDLYNKKGYWGDDPNNYYGQNWVWFGLALVNGEAVRHSQFNKEAAQDLIQEMRIKIEDPELQIKNAPKQKLDLSSWWGFDGGMKKPNNTIVFKGEAKGWYFGGAGGMLSGIADYTGILINVDGKEGKVKIELYGKDNKKYIYETLAVSANNLYLPFESFNEEVNYQPVGGAFARSIGAEKIQIIAIGTSETSPVDFTLQEIYLIDNPKIKDQKK